jgi:hypothetical protein
VELQQGIKPLLAISWVELFEQEETEGTEEFTMWSDVYKMRGVSGLLMRGTAIFRIQGSGVRGQWGNDQTTVAERWCPSTNDQ